ncbi:4-hydroxyphenylpyruvate dioxygenase-like [Colias croceus]|uniref:4-hydroxyphenylpyruvate dioxygenase-like n=1 Tax=Colias crocea TaxID=72248 RepID=UPI001E27B7CD|nr:4-hydroxyphenylpyruvate dioxygenase-like [Colias croceus]XP_045498070.1 4-hydroxyphenylpyruvate dioxygenase-like [Colias croceus]XP_045498071.1 4-hydroxyphenylpyruvate dioxygenase-like [Colias croceus]
MTQTEVLEAPSAKVVNFDHLTFWVANAKTASSYFVTRFGFRPLAVREPTEKNPISSYVVRLNKITIVFESPTNSDGDISKDLAAHGDFVKDVAFEVNSLDVLIKTAKAQGAEVVKDITEEKDGDGIVRYAVLKTYGDNTHSLVDRSKYKGEFLPGFVLTKDDDPLNKLLPGTNLSFIDHVEGNMADGTLEDSVTWYEKHLNMHRFWCVDYTHDLVPYSCINSASVINQGETVLLSMNEAAKGLRPTSKASEFVKALGTSGVEHVALYTDDIVTTMRNLRSRGAEIVTWPSTYYENIKEKLEVTSLKVKETIDELKEENILIDFDERGYMLQAFTKHVQVRPTLFLEIIQRNNHRGFGAMNYKWVFEAIEQLGEKNDTAKTENA